MTVALAERPIHDEGLIEDVVPPIDVASVMEHYVSCTDSEHNARALRLAHELADWAYVRSGQSHLRSSASIAKLVLERACVCERPDAG